MSCPSLRFTHLSIPVEIIEMEELSPSDMFLLAFIDALYSKDHGGCFASNEYFAKRFHLKEDTISKMITKLMRLGLIEKVSFNGKTRVIRACKEKWFGEDRLGKKSYSESEKNPTQTRKKILGSHNIYSKAYKKEDIGACGATTGCAGLTSSEISPKKKSKKKKRDPNVTPEERQELIELCGEKDAEECIARMKEYRKSLTDQEKANDYTDIGRIKKWGYNALKEEREKNSKNPQKCFRSIKDKISEQFKSGEEYNGTFINFSDFEASFSSSTGYNLLTLKYNIQGFWNQFCSFCRKRGIPVKE